MGKASDALKTRKTWVRFPKVFFQNLFGFELIEKLLRVIISPPSYNTFLDFNHL
jgi:hypothetical protein